MKLYKFFIIALVFIGSSCKKSFFTDVNQNPNAVSTVKPNLLLPTVEAALAYTQGGDLSRYSTLAMQQTFGHQNQSESYYIYGYSPGVFDNVWPDLYTSVMENDYSLIQIADAGGYNAYSGIARILMAYTLQVTVDIWGKVPYSQAFQGNQAAQNLHPAYDNDQALYDTIVSLINVGTTLLGNTNAGLLTPGSDDVIFKGGAAAWIKFGHAIKARLYLHQSKGNVSMAGLALSELGQSFTGNGDNSQYVFGSSETSANPWYQFNEQRPGDITFAAAPVASMLLGLNDPRYSIFIDSANERNDTSSHHYGGLNEYYGGISSPVEFICYDELLFAKAEATLRSSGNIAQAQVYYDSAILANMVKLGVPTGAITTYIAANGTLPPAVNAAIAQVATQEYIALYLNPEVWVLWRRTGSPSLTSTVQGAAIPRRLLYPQSEYNLNSANVPAGVTLYVPRVFWDN